MNFTFNLNKSPYHEGESDKSFIFSINSTNCSNDSIATYETENTIGFLSFNAQGPSHNVITGYTNQRPIMSCYNIKNSNDGNFGSFPVYLSLTATLFLQTAMYSSGSPIKILKT
jgi:hypothetical protein